MAHECPTCRQECDCDQEDTGGMPVPDDCDCEASHEDGRDPLDDDDPPQVQCPKCGAWVADYDGFGVLAHTKPAYPNGCGYCSHPAIDDGVCGICGEKVK